MAGKFITFEGSEGSGKSTQIKMIVDYLQSVKVPVRFVREPGGVKISEQIREILLDVKNKDMGQECETLLYMAARAQLVAEVIKPALAKGENVLCDRFLDSTKVYQGYGCGVNLKAIEFIGKFATQDIAPDLTFFFDIDAQTGLSRINRKMDRIESRDLDYHNRVRDGYLKLAKMEPNRIKRIAVDKNKDEIHQLVKEQVKQLLGIK